MEGAKSYYDSFNLDINSLDIIFKFYPDGIVFKNSNLKYISVNDVYLKIFSVPSIEDVVGSDFNKFLPSKIRKLINDADNEIMRNRYPLNYILNPDNGKILSITSSPIIHEGIFVGILSCVKDISQEEKLKENFVNKYFDRLNAERNLQSQRETFVASIGHDLKNPTMAQIRGLELLLKGKFGKLSSEQNEIVEMILDSCRYMNGMLASLLATYRDYGGAVKLNFEEFSLTELVNECLSEMIYVAKDKSLTVKINTNGTYFVYADRVQIKRVIMNLISNAIKYAYKNTELNLSIYSDYGSIIFEFENKSPYIPKEKQNTIFARYVSYAELHKEIGTGLGLYSSKKIIESHGGEIYVKSFEDNRNIFGFKIPIKQPADNQKEVFL